MKKYLISIFSDIFTMISIVSIAQFSIQTNNILLSIILWFIAFTILDFHVYINNKVENYNNLFYINKNN